MNPSKQAHGEQDILVDRSREGVALLTLNRPARLNALSQPTVRRLCAAIDDLAQDDSARVLVITGAGRGFCAGWDLASPLARRDDAPLEGEPTVAALMAGQELFAGMVRRLRALDKVVIAAVNGAAVGAGFALTLGADIRVAARSASFHVGAVRIGLTAGECGISYHLPRLVGASRAFELMLTGRPLPAEEADRIGLLAALVDDSDLLPRALALAAEVLRNTPYATSDTKQVM